MHRDGLERGVALRGGLQLVMSTIKFAIKVVAASLAIQIGASPACI